MGTERRVRPFGVVTTPFRLCRFTVIVLATMSTSSRHRSALISPTRSPASPARHTPVYQSSPSSFAAARRRAYCAKSHATTSGRSTLNIPTLRRLHDQLAINGILERLRQHHEDVVDALLAEPLLDEIGAELRDLGDRDLVERHAPEPRLEM